MDTIRDGDHNTWYFHLSTIIRRRNRIETLQNEDGEWITEPAYVRKRVVDFFAQLYTEPEPERRCSTLLRDRFPILDQEAYRQLAKPFTTIEIWAAVASMGLFKALGPDGFQALFYQHYWDLVRENVCDMVMKVL